MQYDCLLLDSLMKAVLFGGRFLLRRRSGPKRWTAWDVCGGNEIRRFASPIRAAALAGTVFDPMQVLNSRFQEVL